MFGAYDPDSFVSVVDILMKKAKQKNIELSITFNSDGSAEWTMKPFVPFRYSCPYSCNCDKESKT